MIYLSGKMTGEPNYRNIFEKYKTYVADKFKEETFNPVELSDEIISKYNMSEEDSFSEENRKIFLKEDIKALLNCDTIYMLPNWEDSRGAIFEKYVATQCVLKIIEENIII